MCWSDFNGLPVSMNFFLELLHKTLFFTRGQSLLVHMCNCVTDWFPVFCIFVVGTNRRPDVPSCWAAPLSISRAAADWCGVCLCRNYRNGRDMTASDRAWYWTHKQSPPAFQHLPTLSVPKEQTPPPTPPPPSSCVSAWVSLTLYPPYIPICVISERCSHIFKNVETF